MVVNQNASSKRRTAYAMVGKKGIEIVISIPWNLVGDRGRKIDVILEKLEMKKNTETGIQDWVEATRW